MMNFVKNIVKRHFVKIIIGAVVIIAIIVVLGALNSPKKGTPPPSDQTAQDPADYETRVLETLQPKQPPPSPPKKEQPEPQLSRPIQETQVDTVSQSGVAKLKEQHKSEIAQLQKEQKSLAKQIAQIKADEKEQHAWHHEQIQTLDNHARQIEDLGRTLQQVFKTPRQIRIIATDLQGQANTLRSQAQSGGLAVGSSPVTQHIQTEKQSLLGDMASDLNDIALKLQQTQGNPSRVKVIALEIQRKSEGLQSTIESKRNQKIPVNTQLMALEKKHDSMNAKIQELQRQLVAENL